MQFLCEEQLISCNWYDFERMVYRTLQHSGWKGLVFTSKSHDHGADIIGLPPNSSQLAVVQCKHTSASSVSVKGINDLVRACDYYSASRGILATNSKLSGSAILRLLELKDHYSLRHWGLKELCEIGRTLSSLSRCRKTPRGYQQDAINEVISAFNEGVERALVVFATGLGKSIILAEVCHEFAENRGQSVLILADKVSLIEQLESCIWPQLGPHVPTRLWDGLRKPSQLSGVTIATQQTVLNALRRGEDLSSINIVLIDECHHAAAPTFRETLSSLNFDHLLGVTATPWRGDEQRISEIFGRPLATMGIVEGIYKGFLADVEYTMFLDNIDWQAVESNTTQHISIKELNSRLFLPARDEDLCTKVIEDWNKRGRPPVITFCRSIDHAIRLSELFSVMGLPSKAIHSREMPMAERARTIVQFRAGLFSNLVGVDMLNEGIDLPDVGMVVFARITHSRRIFVQQLGRGLRVTENKSEVAVLDFVADIRRLAEGYRLNGEALEVSRRTEIYRGKGADIVRFDYRTQQRFVEEYLADIADLEESDQVRLNFIE